MINISQKSNTQAISIFDETSCISGTSEDDRMFFKDDSMKPLFSFDHNEKENPDMNFHLKSDCEQPGVLSQSHAYDILDLQNKFFDGEMSNSVIPNVDTYDNEDKQSSSPQGLSSGVKHDSSSLTSNKTGGFNLPKNIDCNSCEDVNKSHQSQTMSKINLISEINPNIKDQLIDVFLKKSNCNANGGQRKDVLNKGSLRYLRKVYKHLFLKMFVHKRKRAEQSKAKHFEDILNQFKNVWLEPNASILGQEQNLEMFELIGRLIDSKKYSLLSEEYASLRSVEIANFVTLYNKCCTKYKQDDFKNIITSKFFKLMLKSYDNIKSKGLLERFKELSKKNFESNLEHIRIYIS